MKILHTSDWHIGRFLNQRSLLGDQAAILEGLRALLRRELPDVLIIAGDLYDRSIPSREALSLVDDILDTVILELKIPTIIIGGNHDGGQRLAFTSGILEKRGLYIRGVFTPSPEPIVLEDGQGGVAFWPVPFVKPVEYRDITGEESVRDYQDMYAAILEDIEKRMDPSLRHVLITHGMILSHLPEDGDLDDSVRPIEIGGISFARSSLFGAFDYVALGHLHRPQRVGDDRIRYAGSLFKYSFSEVNQHKSVTLVDMDGSGEVDIRSESLPILRDMAILTGTLDDLTGASALDHPGREDYIKVILTDGVRRLNPMEQLKKVYPNVLEMEYQSQSISRGSTTTKRIKERLSDPLALFEDFYEQIHGEPLTPEKQAVAREIMEETHETH